MLKMVSVSALILLLLLLSDLLLKRLLSPSLDTMILTDKSTECAEEGDFLDDNLERDFGVEALSIDDDCSCCLFVGTEFSSLFAIDLSSMNDFVDLFEWVDENGVGASET